MKLLLEKKYAQNIKKINYAHGYQQEGKKLKKTNEQCIIIESIDIDACKKAIQAHPHCTLCIPLS